MTLAGSLLVFAAGHVLVAVTSSLEVMLVARVVTAVATGAFWSVGAATAQQRLRQRGGRRVPARSVSYWEGDTRQRVGCAAGFLWRAGNRGRGTFWALAILALVAAVGVARLVPADASNGAVPLVRKELHVLKNPRLGLVLAVCAAINAGVLSVYSYSAPLITDRAGLGGAVIPIALMVFGVEALIGNLAGGRLGDTHPYRTTFATTGVTVLACTGI